MPETPITPATAEPSSPFPTPVDPVGAGSKPARQTKKRRQKNTPVKINPSLLDKPKSKRKRGRLDDSVDAPREAKRRRGRLDDSVDAPREAKRRRGRLDDSVDAPREAKRRRGAQPGNRNAMTHGFRELCAPEISEPPSGSEDRVGYAKKPTRKRGAQPGNRNAMTHGFRELCAPEISEPPSGSEDRVGYAKKPKRKRGAQPGNRNAMTHGFYARRLPRRELEGLDQTAVTSLKDEIDVMRVFSRKVAELGADVEELEDAKSVLNTLSNATSSINRLVRTHVRIPDPTGDPAALLRQALLELEDEWPELKAFGDQFRDKPREKPTRQNPSPD